MQVSTPQATPQVYPPSFPDWLSSLIRSEIGSEESSQKDSQKSSQKIIALIAGQPKITIDELAIPDETENHTGQPRGVAPATRTRPDGGMRAEVRETGYGG